MSLEIGPYRRRTECRGCKGHSLVSVLDYGELPLAGDFLLPGKVGREFVYPLDLSVCGDCSLLQVQNVVDPDTLFSDYRYLSSVTTTLTEHFRAYARFLAGTLPDREQDLVVDVGCNDGVLLAPLRDLGVRAVGVDAAPNVVELARERGHEVVPGFFTPELAGRIREAFGPAQVITASNVFAHIDDLDQVLLGVERLLAPGGRFIVEVHYVGDLLEDFQFETVYHEHLCYYSLSALERLLGRFGFEIRNSVRLPMHGGAVRVTSARKSDPGERSREVREMFRAEESNGFFDPETYLSFGREARAHRDRLHELLQARRNEGRTLSAYGAAGRAVILLNYCGLDKEMVKYVVDQSPFRAGRFIPGVHIPIVLPDVFHADPTDDCLVTAWNYRPEILRKESAFLAEGGTFIVPLPRTEVVTRGG